MTTTIRSTPMTKGAIIHLTAITVLIHFSRAAADPEIRLLFLLNGLGYLVLAVAFCAPQLQDYHRRIRWGFISYTSLTIILYFVWVAMNSDWNVPIGPVDKVVEIVLVILLWRS